jgi:hypothetical protein
MRDRLLEIRVPISPTPDFFRRIHFMAASLRRLGGVAAETEIVVFVGGDEEARDLHDAFPWSREYPIIWRWADREVFRRDSYWETSREVFRHRTRARHVMCVDADVIFVRDFSDFLSSLDRDPAVAAVIAHASPFHEGVPTEKWRQLTDAYGVAPLNFNYEHTGWGFMGRHPDFRFTPAYFNFGMVVAPAEMMNKISANIADADRIVTENVETFFRFQIALTLVIQKHQLATRALPLRYNFPNDPRFDLKYPEELRDVRVLHYLRCEIIDREKDFKSLDQVAGLVQRRDLRGSNEVLRKCIGKLFEIVREEEAKRLSKRAEKV